MGYRPPKGVRPPQLEGKRTGRPKGSRQPLQLLRDMRWVVSHAEEQDKTLAHTHCRKWLKAAPSSFLAKLADLEKAHAARLPVRGREQGPSKVVEDEGSARALALIDRILAEGE